ncbi:MAG: sulfatase [Deltaproteobacteria bacterium]|nr:sulfatase [Deltaproteobacteria bacterium]
MLVPLILLSCSSRDELVCRDCSLILISIDTLRADHLGCYGYDRPTSPNIDALAERAVRFANATSPSFRTAESHMSMFTGVYPSVHGVMTALDRSGRKTRVPDAIPVVTETLRRAGFTTAAFTGGGNVGPAFGFNRGMDTYDSVDEPSWRKTFERARAFVRTTSERYFLFIHTYHVHDPYLPDPPWRDAFDPGYAGNIEADRAALVGSQGADYWLAHDRFWARVDGRLAADVRHLAALYDGEIREVDDEIGSLLAASQPARTVVVLTSDHGEQFGEHGGFLHDHIYEELTHVPLLIAGPTIPRGRTIEPRVSLVGLAPTLLDLLGIQSDPAAAYQVASLVPVVRGAAGPDAIFSERPDELAALIWDGKKLIVPLAGRPAPLQLFDLASDPSEKHDVGQRAPYAAAMRARFAEIALSNRALRERLVPPGAQQPAVLDDATQQQLRGLGYLR